MASMVFKETAVIGIALEDVRQAIIAIADTLNRERIGVQGFANVYVSGLLKEPPPLTGMSFVVQYSDHDDNTPWLVAEALQRLVRGLSAERLFYHLRDPYCA